MLKSINPPSNLILPDVYTLDTLPPPADNIDKYARVTDLFGSKRDLVLASQDGNGSYWQPVRPVYKGELAVTGNHVLTPMKTPSVLTLTGTIPLGVTRKIELSPQMVFPGAQFVIRNRLTSLLGSLQLISGLTTLLNALALNASIQYYFDPVKGWEEF